MIFKLALSRRLLKTSIDRLYLCLFQLADDIELLTEITRLRLVDVSYVKKRSH